MATPSKKVVVIGAGWAGLVGAKTYLEVDPKIDLTIFDAERTVGGVWCADRCYPGFAADSPSGMFDFSDLPMREAVGLKDWDELPAENVQKYLEAYCDKFDLTSRLRLSTRVSKVLRNEDGQRWDVYVDGSNEIVSCDKLLVATGLTSKPNWPDIPRDEYTGPVMHTKDIGLNYKALISEKVRRVTVYGGCKSSIDAISMCIAHGKHVDWVIRESGNGPGLMLEVRVLGGIHAYRFAGRWRNIFTPSIFSLGNFWYRFLQSGQNGFGSWFLNKFWSNAIKTPLSMGPYKVDCENTRKLRPETNSALFFTAGASALHGNKQFVKELQSGNLITVHRATITSMSGTTVHLNNGENLESDAAVFGTGWNAEIDIFSPAERLNLGIPAPLEVQDPATAAYWDNLRKSADAEVVSLLPILKNPPPHYERPINYTPFRLYRYILPSSLASAKDRSVVFLGQVTSVQTTIVNEVAALWSVAWMEDLLPEKAIPKTKAEIDHEIAKVNAWCERRYLGRGRSRQIASAEVQHVTDVLMEDLGLEVYRKGGLKIRDALVPYCAQDYKGIVQELLRKRKREV
ncbi:hypothetical protein F5884DRAFT_816850 [Xylogone sp. PMI_703]|nr:hypothetical protein F5884DRAFT_816850 [Xylogone sp. PMI_703]